MRDTMKWHLLFLAISGSMAYLGIGFTLYIVDNTPEYCNRIAEMGRTISSTECIGSLILFTWWSMSIIFLISALIYYKGVYKIKLKQKG